jgi:hypothetical protein
MAQHPVKRPPHKKDRTRASEESSRYELREQGYGFNAGDPNGENDHDHEHDHDENHMAAAVEDAEAAPANAGPATPAGTTATASPETEQDDPRGITAELNPAGQSGAQRGEHHGHR